MSRVTDKTKQSGATRGGEEAQTTGAEREGSKGSFKVKVALAIAWLDQYKEWEYVKRSIQEQTLVPDELYLCIDDSKQTPPSQIQQKGFPPFEALHSPKEFDGRFTRGFLVNKVVEKTSCDIVILADGDSVLSPFFVALHTALQSGRMEEWSFTAWDEFRQEKASVGTFGETVYLGPRYFIPEVGMLPLLEKNVYAQLLPLSTFAPEGCRGKEDGTAAMMSANMSFATEMARKVPWAYGITSDAKWWKQLKEKGVDVKTRPTPDICNVLHMGPTHCGQYW